MPAPRKTRLAPSTRYRHGGRDKTATRVHSEQSREWRRNLACEELNADVLARFVSELERCGDVVAAADRVGVTSHQVYGRMRWDGEVEELVEATLTRVCRAAEWSGWCGRPKGYKLGGRCRDCRRAKR